MTDRIISVPSCADPFDPESISVADALLKISQQITGISETETLPIRECLGRFSADKVVSPINVPGHDNAAMDGFAIAYADLNEGKMTEFHEIGTAYAGIVFEGISGQGECVRIMTGAVIPKGADTIIMQEQAEISSDGLVRIDSNHRSGENLRYAGEDVAEGQIILDKGDSIDPPNLGVLASLGFAHLKVIRKPVVAFFSTGDELVSHGQALSKGQIYDSNRYTLYALLSRLPVEIHDLGVIEDDADKIEKRLTEASKTADLIITTGGVSVGEADYIKQVLTKIGSIEFWKIAIKPGRPLTFGQINQCLFMGLPGNPVAVMVTFDHFVLPVLRQLSNAAAKTQPIIPAICADKLRKRPGRLEIQRGIAARNNNNQWVVAKTGKQGSGILTSMAKANCFILLSDDNAGVEPGDKVNIQLFDWL